MLLYLGAMRSFVVVGIMLMAFEPRAQQNEASEFLAKSLTTAEILPVEFKDSLRSKDFSTLWTTAVNWKVFGFIGDDYQRLRIKMLSVIKDPSEPLLHRVYGKDMVKHNICEFQGELSITNIRRYASTSSGVDEAYADSAVQGQYLVGGTYRFLEDPVQRHSGTLQGTFVSYFYIDAKGGIRYDDIEDVADGYCNNQFVGTWTSSKGDLVKRCNWGDSRIPNAEALDGGAGEFGPDEKYAPNGWQSYLDAYFYAGPRERALAIERAEWWK